MRFYLVIFCSTVSLIVFSITVRNLNKSVLVRASGQRDSLVFKMLPNEIRVYKKAEPLDTVLYLRDVQDSKTAKRLHTFGPRILTLNNNPKLMVWIITFSIMAACACVLCFAVGENLRRQIRDLMKASDDGTVKKKHKRQLWVSGVVIVVVISVLTYVNVGVNEESNFIASLDVVAYLKVLFADTDLFWNTVYFGEGLCFLVGGVALYGITVVNLRISEQGSAISPELYGKYNSELNQLIAACSILIVFSIITTSFLNAAASAAMITIPKEINLFPIEFIYSYGLLFTVVLALIYVPTYQNLLSISPGLDTSGKPVGTLYGDIYSLISILLPLLGSGIPGLINLIHPS